MESARQSGTPFYFVAQESHVGYDRLINEDSIGVFNTPNGELFVVADGLSGQAGGGVASRLAMSAFHKFMLEESGDPAELMRQAVAQANEAVIGAGELYPELKGLGSSLVALLLRNNEAWHISVGESRLYLSSASGFRRLNRGGLGQAKAAVQAGEGSACQTLGAEVDLASLVPGRHHYKADDTFLLATSGLAALMDDKEIKEILGRPLSPEERAMSLIESAVQAGGADNISVQVVAFKPGPEEEEGAFGSNLFSGWKGFAIGLFCGLVLGAGLMYWFI